MSVSRLTIFITHLFKFANFFSCLITKTRSWRCQFKH